MGGATYILKMCEYELVEYHRVLDSFFCFVRLHTMYP
jgi:hypothetical protein